MCLVAAAAAIAHRVQLADAADRPLARSEPLLPRFEGPRVGGGVAGTDLIGRRRALVYVFSPSDADADEIARIVSRLAQDAPRANIALLGVSRELDASLTRPFLQKHALELPVVEDRDRSIAAKLRIPAGKSALLIVDASGYIVAGFAGVEGDTANREEQYETEMRRVLHLEKAEAGAHIALGLRPTAPDVSVRSLEGELLQLGSRKGQVSVLVFFLPTCPHCHEALKFLQRLQATLAAPAFQIVPISIREQLQPLLDMQAQQRIDLTLYTDPGSVAQRAYGHAGMVPDVIVINRDLRVVARHRGTDARVETLLTMEVRRALGVPNPLLLSKSGFSGEEACRVCHEQAHETWSLTSHAYAFETLVEHGEERNAECLPCHTVGWKQPGGYSPETPLVFLEGVQCETCHGRGGPHQSADFAKRGFEAVCAECHTPQHSLNFSFAERLPLISHAANAAFTGLSLEERTALLARRDKRERTLFQAGAFVGSEHCQSCHMREYELWAKSPHAHAFDTLRSRGEAGNAKCAGCHVTGYEKQGGYPEGGDRLVHVGCESCHGPGAAHVAEGAAKKGSILALADKCDSCVILQICGSCHTDAWSPNFEFELDQRLKSIHHGGATQARAAGVQGATR